MPYDFSEDTFSQMMLCYSPDVRAVRDEVRARVLAAYPGQPPVIYHHGDLVFCEYDGPAFRFRHRGYTTIPTGWSVDFYTRHEIESGRLKPYCEAFDADLWLLMKDERRRPDDVREVQERILRAYPGRPDVINFHQGNFAFLTWSDTEPVSWVIGHMSTMANSEEIDRVWRKSEKFSFSC